MTTEIPIRAEAVPAALRETFKAAPDKEKVLAEVAAQVIEQLIARVRRADADLESYMRSFKP
jgi:hypothetical protein